VGDRLFLFRQIPTDGVLLANELDDLLINKAQSDGAGSSDKVGLAPMQVLPDMEAESYVSETESIPVAWSSGYADGR